MLADLDAVLQFVNHLLDHPQIVLLGICSGAKLAFYYARNGNLPVQHVIEMSSPVLRQNEAESTLAVNQTKSALKGYAKKACRIETWKKLTGGEIHFQAVWRNITRPVKRLFVRKSKATVLHTVSQTKKKPFVNFKGQMLLIHGEKDPETQPALEQIQEMLQRYRIPSDVHIVKNANHSFYSIVWEKEIITLIADWLKNK
jgi:dienelactone hydrolase